MFDSGARVYNSNSYLDKQVINNIEMYLGWMEKNQAYVLGLPQRTVPPKEIVLSRNANTARQLFEEAKRMGNLNMSIDEIFAEISKKSEQPGEKENIDLLPDREKLPLDNFTIQTVKPDQVNKDDMIIAYWAPHATAPGQAQRIEWDVSKGMGLVQDVKPIPEKKPSFFSPQPSTTKWNINTIDGRYLSRISALEIVPADQWKNFLVNNPQYAAKDASARFFE